MNSTFDPTLVQTMVNEIDQEADDAARNHMMMGAIVGFSTVWLMGNPMSWAAAVATVFAASMGFIIGRERGREAKLRNQLALCQLRIESNTRALLARSRLNPSESSTSIEPVLVTENFGMPSQKEPEAEDAPTQRAVLRPTKTRKPGAGARRPRERSRIGHKRRATTPIGTFRPTLSHRCRLSAPSRSRATS